MKFGYLSLGLLMGCLLFLVAWPTVEAQAHFCDDNYAEQPDRENCWWRYWNDLSTDADRQGQAVAASTTPTPTPAVDGSLCDRFYTSQPDRENCWWRFWNGLPLVPEESISPATATPEPGTTSGDTATASSGRRSRSTSGTVDPTPTPDNSQVILRVPGHDDVLIELDEDGSTDLSEVQDLEPDCDKATLNVHTDENGQVVIEVVECRSDS